LYEFPAMRHGRPARPETARHDRAWAPIAPGPMYGSGGSPWRELMEKRATFGHLSRYEKRSAESLA
jgi:hypothetical protein